MQGANSELAELRVKYRKLKERSDDQRSRLSELRRCSKSNRSVGTQCAESTVAESDFEKYRGGEGAAEAGRVAVRETTGDSGGQQGAGRPRDSWSYRRSREDPQERQANARAPT